MILLAVYEPTKPSKLVFCLVLFLKKFVYVFVVNISSEGVSRFILVFEDRAVRDAIYTPPVSSSLQI